jgi:hypothetical protein
MKRYIFLYFALVLSAVLTAQSSISLSGKWEMLLDPNDMGLRAHWWEKPFAETVQLPGSLTTNGKGNATSLQSNWTGDIIDSTYFFSAKYKKYREGEIKIPFWLKPTSHYVGAAWYRRKVLVPTDWDKKRVILHLERCHWETTVYINGGYCGTQNSLVAPHQYDISAYLQKGENTVCIRVDNRIKIHLGPNSHSISEHTQSNWNGIAGEMSLNADLPEFIQQVEVYPNVSKAQAKVVVSLQQPRNQTFTGKLIIRAVALQNDQTPLPDVEQPVQFNGESTQLEVIYPIPSPQLWDEFSPNLYRLTAVLIKNGSTKGVEQTTTFGMREIGVQGTNITINGRPIFLRGDLDCAAFPVTGYPPTTAAPWEKIFKTIQEYGLNHLRFHSWCPPEAAFEAADKLGVYLYVESPLWANQSSAVGTGGLVDEFIYKESERILREYGNHPSFCMMSYGNEPDGKNQNAFLGRWVDHFKAQDPRRLYTSAAGWPMIPENQFHVSSDARIQRWGEGNKSIINGQRPRTDYDWRDIIKPSKVPYISHEIGQWCAYPNFKEMPKYSGVLKPTNFEIFKETLEANGMGKQADDFLFASGRLQTLCYKADIEAALRTPGFGGFQLLGLHDFPGQGTALVGALDVFYETKGYTTGAEYRMFCNSTVPLARLPKLLYKNAETMTATIEIAHFGAAALKNQTIHWEIVDGKGTAKQEGNFKMDLITIGNNQPVGNIQVPLSAFKTPQKLTLKVSLPGTTFHNQWEFWVYPSTLTLEKTTNKVIVAQTLTPDILQKLNDGASVLWLPYGQIGKEKGQQVQIGFSSIFWNTAWTSGQAPHTLGILCNPEHPMFKHFPTEKHSNYQWQDIVSQSQAMIMDGWPQSIQSLIQPIDTWFENRRLALAFEGKVGKGKIMVCSINLADNLEERLGTRQMRHSILSYMGSKDFNPTQQLDAALLKGMSN